MEEPKEVCVLSPKGAALIAAVEAGLLPEVDVGWDDTGFNRFWELFEPDLRKQIDYEVNNMVMMLNQQSTSTGNGRRETA